MEKSRLILALLALAALAAIGYSASGSNAPAKVADGCCSHCSACGCHK